MGKLLPGMVFLSALALLRVAAGWPAGNQLSLASLAVYSMPLAAAVLRGQPSYLILVSLNSTCLRATGSYFLNDSFSVLVRAFFLVT
jgi:hypothetical protein